jgi:hypothetical protein
LLSGATLTAQRNAVAEFLNGGRWALAPEFVELIKAALVIAKLHRLTRNGNFF